MKAEKGLDLAALPARQSSLTLQVTSGWSWLCPPGE